MTSLLTEIDKAVIASSVSPSVLIALRAASEKHGTSNLGALLLTLAAAADDIAGCSSQPEVPKLNTECVQTKPEEQSGAVPVVSLQGGATSDDGPLRLDMPRDLSLAVAEPTGDTAQTGSVLLGYILSSSQDVSALSLGEVAAVATDSGHESSSFTHDQAIRHSGPPQCVIFASPKCDASNTRYVSSLVKRVVHRVEDPRSGLLETELSGSPLTAACRAALREIFHNFASPRGMSGKDLHAYFMTCGVNANSVRIEKIIECYAATKTEEGAVLTLDDFCKFYRDACVSRPDVVWKDLYSQGYDSVVHQITRVKIAT